MNHFLSKKCAASNKCPFKGSGKVWLLDAGYNLATNWLSTHNCAESNKSSSSNWVLNDQAENALICVGAEMETAQTYGTSNNRVSNAKTNEVRIFMVEQTNSAP